MLILHYTGMRTAAEALDRLCDPAAKVSAHYLIDEGGAVARLVPEERRAWHAGVASWRGVTDINGRSIGIELANPGHQFGYRPFAEPQMAALVTLATGLVHTHGIAPRHVLGHSDVAPARKQDPGELFDWARLAHAGVGLWPAARPVTGEMGMVFRAGDGGSGVAALRAVLADFGYGVATGGPYDAELGAVVTAFQRHFRPGGCDGVADPETVQLVYAVLALAG
ncbi:MAG: N-acetylmuramoyl-L-alanine amidase [Alphaproteobacteria bacterium]|nr:N-acetylmuramoyl-L-alanine amidase [Alphaproteobacteria bacterium]